MRIENELLDSKSAIFFTGTFSDEAIENIKKQYGVKEENDIATKANKTTIGSERRVISKRTIKRQMLFTTFRKRSFDFSHKHRIKTNHIITVTDYNGFKRKCQILNPPRCTLRRFLRLGLDVQRKRRREPLLLILRLRIIYPSKDQKND